MPHIQLLLLMEEILHPVDMVKIPKFLRFITSHGGDRRISFTNTMDHLYHYMFHPKQWRDILETYGYLAGFQGVLRTEIFRKYKTIYPGCSIYGKFTWGMGINESGRLMTGFWQHPLARSFCCLLIDSFGPHAWRIIILSKWLITKVPQLGLFLF